MSAMRQAQLRLAEQTARGEPAGLTSQKKKLTTNMSSHMSSHTLTHTMPNKKDILAANYTGEMLPCEAHTSMGSNGRE